MALTLKASMQWDSNSNFAVGDWWGQNIFATLTMVLTSVIKPEALDRLVGLLSSVFSTFCHQNWCVCVCVWRGRGRWGKTV